MNRCIPRAKWSVPAVHIHCIDKNGYTTYTLQTVVHTVPIMEEFLGTAPTLPASGSVYAVYLQPTLQIHWNYIAYPLHFSLG